MNSMDKDIDHVLVTEEQMKAKVAEQKKQLAKKTQEYKDFRARAIPINPQLKKVLRKLRHPFSKR